MKNTLLTLATTLFLLVSCGPEDGTDIVAVTDIIITPTPDPMTLVVGGEPGRILVEIAPANATYKTVEISVSPEGVVTVDNEGIVTPVGPGTATITATATPAALYSSGIVLETCEVTVHPSGTPSDTYTGTMWVAPNTDDAFVLTGLEVKFALSEDKTTADIEMMQVKFAETMPIRLNMLMSGVSLTPVDNEYNVSGDNIIPTALNGQQFPQYTITDLTGTVNANGLEFEMMCGEYPVQFISPAPSIY